jgi:hypothetical protein
MKRDRCGFTLVEVTVVSGLMVLLALLLASLWRGMGRSATDLIGRSQLVQERDLALVSFCRDLEGNIGDPDRRGCLQKGQWIAWDAPANAVFATESDLRLLFDGRSDPTTPISYTWASPPNTIVRYLVAADPAASTLTKVLVRRVNENSATDFIVAKHVSSMRVNGIAGRPDAFNVVLCFNYQSLTLTCDFTVEMPSPVPTAMP